MPIFVESYGALVTIFDLAFPCTGLIPQRFYSQMRIVISIWRSLNSNKPGSLSNPRSHPDSNLHQWIDFAHSSGLTLKMPQHIGPLHSWRRRQSYFFFVSQFMAFKYSLIYIKINGISQNHSPLPFHIQNSSFFQVVLLQLSDLSQKQQ